MLLRLVLPLILALLPLASLAQTLPDPQSDTVSDYADLLPPEAEARISAALAQGRADTGVHVVLVTMDKIADHGGAGTRIEDYAKRLFNQWGVGDTARDDGILVLIARGDREMRIALGSGYDSIWDNAAQRVIDRFFLPAFRRDDYIGGIEAGVPATFDLIAAPFAANQPQPPEPPFDWASLGLFAAFGMIASAMLAFAARRTLVDLAVGFRACPSCGKHTLSRRREVQVSATRTTAGQGIAVTQCSACDYRDSKTYAIPRQSPGGSSGGFGGGSSSGGGATGKW
jgi:uncharacterized protein